MKSRAFSARIASLAMLVGIPLMVLAITTVQAYFSPAPKDETQAGSYKISGPYTYENLSIFLVHGKDTLSGKKFLTLQEAMESKVIIVHETKDVNELAIENVSEDQEVYVQSGDIVKGGNQDRVLSTDLIVPPRSGRMSIAAFCVERGRWRQRGNESAGKFESSNEIVATRDLKLAANKAKSQGEVWAKVAEAQDKLSLNAGVSVNSTVSESSLQLSLENSRVKEMTDSYLRKLSGIIEGKGDVIGYAVVINGHVNSADVYGSSLLFRKLWPKLLKASAVEAVAELKKGAKFDQATAQKVGAFFTDAEKGAASENNVSGRIQMVTRESADNILFETRDEKQGKAVLHRSYVRKN
jgi:hypothetical protein